MNRHQFRGLARKYHRYAMDLEADARRVQVSTHPPSDRAETIKGIARQLETVVQDIESEFG